MTRYHRPSPAHEQWLLINSVLISALINAVVNGLLAWVSLNGERSVPLWSIPLIDKPSVLIDTLGTFFLLPFFTTLGITRAVRLAERNGNLVSLEHPPFSERVMARIPSGLVSRSALFGLIVLVALTPFAIAAWTLGADSLTPNGFILYKIILGVSLGLVVTPPIALCALADIPAVAASASDVAAPAID